MLHSTNESLPSAGTHEWSKFLTPGELALLMDRHGGMAIEQAAGMLYNPLAGTWSLSTDMAVNYIAVFRGRAPEGERDAEG